jgi:hypothetical protein
MITVGGRMAVYPRSSVAGPTMVVSRRGMAIHRRLVVTLGVVMLQQCVSEHGSAEAEGEALPAAPLPAAGGCGSGSDADQKYRCETAQMTDFLFMGCLLFG